MGEMDVPTRVLLFLLLITAGQGLVLALIVALQRPRRVSFVYLALFFLLISLGCAEKAIEGIFYRRGEGELPIPLALPLAYFPAIYLHLRHLMCPEARFRWVELGHFVPAVAMEFAAYYLVPGEGIYGGFVLISDPLAVRDFFRVYDVIFCIHFLAYTVVLVRLRRLVESRTEDEELRIWLRRLLPTLMVFWTSWAYVKIVGKAELPGYLISYFVHGAAMVSIYGFGFSFILRMRVPFMRILARQNLMASSSAGSAAYLVMQRVRQMELFRNQKLTLAQAATELKISQRQLSEAVALQGHVNFNDCINQLRVETFKRLARAPAARKLSLFGLAQEVGFASKASFHRAFKKHCGQTPGEFLAASGETGAGVGSVKSQMAI